VSRALRTLKVLRYIIHPNDAFVQQLKEYDFPALRRKLADADLSLSAMAFYFAQRWSTAVRDLGAKEAGLPDFIRLTDKEAKAQASEWGQVLYSSTHLFRARAGVQLLEVVVVAEQLGRFAQQKQDQKGEGDSHVALVVEQL